MTVTVELSEHIYPRHCIESACEAFSHLGDLKLFQQSKSSVSVRISTSDSETLLMHEFLNYVLILSIEQYLKETTPSA